MSETAEQYINIILDEIQARCEKAKPGSGKGTREHMEDDLQSLGHNLKDWVTTTDATMAIHGTSGRGSHYAVGRLLYYCGRGFLLRRKYRNGFQLKATPELIEWASTRENTYPYFQEAVKEFKK